MLAKRLLSHILDNEALTRGLGDPEARLLVEWLVEQAERLAQSSDRGGKHDGQTAGNRALLGGRLWCCPK